ncbi:hypothetical protein D1872_59800 [compost metagenome]
MILWNYSAKLKPLLCRRGFKYTNLAIHAMIVKLLEAIHAMIVKLLEAIHAVIVRLDRCCTSRDDYVT